MRLNNNSVSIKFGSKNNPIKPFTINTSNGTLRVRELNEKDHSKLSKFTVKGFIESTEEWAHLKNAPNCLINENIAFVKQLHKDILAKKDNNSTILIAEDTSKNIKASFILESFSEIPGLEDIHTGYITECLVDKNYRNSFVGSKMFSKLLETANGQFTDIFTEANKTALTFYKRAGFKELDISNPLIKNIAKKIKNYRNDYKSILISKALESSKPWYERISSRLK